MSNSLVQAQIKQTESNIAGQYGYLKKSDYKFIVGKNGQVTAKLTARGKSHMRTHNELTKVEDTISSEYPNATSTSISRSFKDGYIAKVTTGKGKTVTKRFAFTPEAKHHFQDQVQQRLAHVNHVMQNHARAANQQRGGQSGGSVSQSQANAMVHLGFGQGPNGKLHATLHKPATSKQKKSTQVGTHPWSGVEHALHTVNQEGVKVVDALANVGAYRPGSPQYTQEATYQALKLTGHGNAAAQVGEPTKSYPRQLLVAANHSPGDIVMAPSQLTETGLHLVDWKLHYNKQVLAGNGNQATDQAAATAATVASGAASSFASHPGTTSVRVGSGIVLGAGIGSAASLGGEAAGAASGVEESGAAGASTADSAATAERLASMDYGAFSKVRNAASTIKRASPSVQIVKDESAGIVSVDPELANQATAIGQSFSRHVVENPKAMAANAEQTAIDTGQTIVETGSTAANTAKSTVETGVSAAREAPSNIAEKGSNTVSATRDVVSETSSTAARRLEQVRSSPGEALSNANARALAASKAQAQATAESIQRMKLAAEWGTVGRYADSKRALIGVSQRTGDRVAGAAASAKDSLERMKLAAEWGTVGRYVDSKRALGDLATRARNIGFSDVRAGARNAKEGVHTRVYAKGVNARESFNRATQTGELRAYQAYKGGQGAVERVQSFSPSDFASKINTVDLAASQRLGLSHVDTLATELPKYTLRIDAGEFRPPTPTSESVSGIQMEGDGLKLLDQMGVSVRRDISNTDGTTSDVTASSASESVDSTPSFETPNAAGESGQAASSESVSQSALVKAKEVPKTTVEDANAGPLSRPPVASLTDAAATAGLASLASTAATVSDVAGVDVSQLPSTTEIAANAVGVQTDQFGETRQVERSRVIPDVFDITGTTDMTDITTDTSTKQTPKQGSDQTPRIEPPPIPEDPTDFGRRIDFGLRQKHPKKASTPATGGYDLKYQNGVTSDLTAFLGIGEGGSPKRKSRSRSRSKSKTNGKPAKIDATAGMLGGK